MSLQDFSSAHACVGQQQGRLNYHCRDAVKYMYNNISLERCSEKCRVVRGARDGCMFFFLTKIVAGMPQTAGKRSYERVRKWENNDNFGCRPTLMPVVAFQLSWLYRTLRLLRFIS